MKQSNVLKYYLFFLSFCHPFLSATAIPSDFSPKQTSRLVQTDATAIRQENINLMQNVLKENYTGYDLIIISSTIDGEAEYQQQVLEKTFAEISKKDGKKPIILSVVDSIEAGQLIGSIYTWLKAEEKMYAKHADLMEGCKNLIDYIRKNRCKVAIYHNGGKGERFSPLTQSLGNSRGAQALVGRVKNAKGEDIELDVLLAVILQCSSFADTNDGHTLDTFWTSQIAFGSTPHNQLIRSNYAIDKFLVGFDKHHLIPQNIADFGTVALSKAGGITAYYGNKRFATRQGNQYVIDKGKIEKELLSKGETVAYDFGSFSTNIEMWDILIDYWKRKVNFDLSTNHESLSKIKRDIDPHFIQPFIRFLYGMNTFADRQTIDDKLPSPTTLLNRKELEASREIFDSMLKESMPDTHLYIWEDVENEKDPKKKAEAKTCMHEVMEFYLLYRQTLLFKDLSKIFGFIDLGSDIQWFRYRRPIDILNEKLEMLTDLMGKKIEVQLNGTIQESEANEILCQRSYEARLMRGISEEEFVQFNVDGKKITLSLAQVKKGIAVEGIYVKNSFVYDCDLTRGSSIINSVVHHVKGKVIANDAYVESSTSPLIIAKASVIHQSVDYKIIQADREVVSDVFKSNLHPPYHGRMRAPIGYDPKGMPIYKTIQHENGSIIHTEELEATIGYFVERIPYDRVTIKEYSDKTARTEDGRFTFEEIREIKPCKLDDDHFRELIEKKVKQAIKESGKKLEGKDEN